MGWRCMAWTSARIMVSRGFKRYVALAVVARNIHRIGAIVWQHEQMRAQRKTKYADRDTTYKLAA